MQVKWNPFAIFHVEFIAALNHLASLLEKYWIGYSDFTFRDGLTVLSLSFIFKFLLTFLFVVYKNWW